jgi:hypothetical protein
MSYRFASKKARAKPGGVNDRNAAELSVREIYSVGEDIFKRCLPQVNAERNASRTTPSPS